MSKYRAENLRQHLRNGLLLRNPILVQAIGLFVVVAVSTSALSALFFAVVSAAILIIMEILTNLLLKHIPQWLRVGFYALLSFGITIPFIILSTKFMNGKLAAAGVYLPILSVNALISYRCERIAVPSTFKNSFWDGVTTSLGYGAVLFIVGFIRELLGKGAVFGYQIPNFPAISGLLMPFGGFIIIGFMAAMLKWVTARRYGYEATETAVDHIRDEEWEEKNGLRSLFGQSTIAGKLKLKESQLREKPSANKQKKNVKAEKAVKNKAEKPHSPDRPSKNGKAENKPVKKDRQVKPAKSDTPAKPVRPERTANQAKSAKPENKKPSAKPIREVKPDIKKPETKPAQHSIDNDDDFDFDIVLDNYRKRQSDKNGSAKGGKD